MVFDLKLGNGTMVRVTAYTGETRGLPPLRDASWVRVVSAGGTLLYVKRAALTEVAA